MSYFGFTLQICGLQLGDSTLQYRRRAKQQHIFWKQLWKRALQRQLERLLQQVPWLSAMFRCSAKPTGRICLLYKWADAAFWLGIAVVCPQLLAGRTTGGRAKMRCLHIDFERGLMVAEAVITGVHKYPVGTCGRGLSVGDPTSTPPCNPKRRYPLTLQVSGYRLLGLRCSTGSLRIQSGYP